MAHHHKRALIIEEELSRRNQIQGQLSTQGIAVDLSDRLDQGLRAAGQGSYDIIFINDRVLDVSAWKIRLRRLLRNRPGQRVVLVSDLPNWQRAREAFLLGAADHITRPAQVGEVLLALT